VTEEMSTIELNTSFYEDHD